MTDNQFREIIDKMTKCVSAVQRLEEGQVKLEAGQIRIEKDVSELKTDVKELKDGQLRLEEQMKIVNKSLDLLAGENIRTKVRVDILEERVN